jgi:hypothetical protein
MGRTIPLFRIAALLEEEKWKSFRIYLRNNNEKKFFTHMFSFGNLYNSASSNSINPIKIYSIMMSIVFHHYRTLTEKNFSFHSSSGFEVSSLVLMMLEKMILLSMIIIISQQQY